MSRVEQLSRYFRDHGLWWTLVWIVERVIARRRLLGAPASSPHESLTSHWVELTFGATNILSLGLPFHMILSVRVELDRTPDRGAGTITLLDGDTEIRSEVLRPRADVHVLDLPETGVRTPQGRAALRLSHAGSRGIVKVRVGGRALDIIEQLPGDPARASSQTPRSARKLRVLTYRWHVPHQYELFKLGHDFDLVADLPTLLTNRWDLRQRPLPGNARFIPRAEAKPADYDLAIVHFDENVLAPQNSNGVLGPYWGHAFRYLMAQSGVPKVAVCHGTPQFHGQYTPGYDKPDLLQVIEPARRELVEFLNDTLVICNSHQAQAEWGFHRSKVIWHGFDPTEFPPASYEKGILSPLGPAVSARPHYRGYDLYKQVFADFPAEHAPSTLSVPDPSPLYAGNQYATRKFRNYVDAVRRHSVYFNPTLRSPMPRSRGEAMMCGLVTVSADNHDVDRFVRNGVNGFYAREAGELREHLLYLCRNPEATRRIGMEGRRTALKVFHVERYLDDWRETIAQET